MRLSSYTYASRHGVFYFRFPIPTELHPAGQRSHIKVSMGTRLPPDAKFLSRVLALAGHSALALPIVRAMRYDEMREHVRDHFGNLLRKFRERSAAEGPVSGLDLDALAASQGLSAGDADSWADIAHADGTDGLLRAFCEARGIAPELEGRDRALLLAEMHKGYREYVKRAVEHTSEFDILEIEKGAGPAARTISATAKNAGAVAEEMPLGDVLSRYFDELERTKALAPKTESEKRDALALMSELTGDIPPACMTKADAREVKAALFKLPKNRSKNPLTRDLQLSEALEVSGVARIATRTMNVYLGHMQHFFGWAVNNGYATENVFHGLRLKRTARGDDEGRKAFSVDQLKLMFSHLTDANSPLVKKDVHKWPVLIAMFTGMRLNEVAQLEVQDIQLLDEVWCIDVTPDGDDNKRLKNASSKRRVPIHERLKASGFLSFYEAQKATGQSRLFPSLSYSPQNGYGRNVGRWFNERFVPELELGNQGLVFHCLRHTMITRLAQAGVDEPMIKALAGHSQTGVTFGTYFKEGFLPSQLQVAINSFAF